MKNKINFYASPFPRIKSYKQMIDLSVEYDLFAVECLNMYEFSTPNVEVAKQLREYADNKGVHFPCISLFIDLTSEDSAVQIETAKKYAQVAAILGSPYLHHTITPEIFNYNRILANKKEHFEKGVLAVREIYDYAESLGVKTIFEDQGFIFNGVENFGEFLSKVDRNVGVVADFGNVHQSKDDIETFIGAFKDRVSHVHIKDITFDENVVCGGGFPSLRGKNYTEVEIGNGDIDFKKCLDILKGTGYNGYYALEYGAGSDDSDSIKNVIEKLNLWLG